MTALIIDRIKQEPLALRAFLAAGLNLAVVAGLLDTGAAAETEAATLALLNLLLFKGARDRVKPSGLGR